MSSDPSDASEDSVTRWIQDLKAGDPEAMHNISRRYYERLVQLADKRLSATVRRVVAGGDVANTALMSFFEGVREGRFPELHDRQNLWSLLLTITTRSALKELERATAQKRGRGAVRGHSAVLGPVDAGRQPGFDNILGDEPSPEFALQVAEEYEQLLELLQDEKLCAVAIWKMQGYSREEIGEKLGCAPVTVGRKLRIIRQRWEKVLDQR